METKYKGHGNVSKTPSVIHILHYSFLRLFGDISGARRIFMKRDVLKLAQGVCRSEMEAQIVFLSLTVPSLLTVEIEVEDVRVE